MRPFAYERAADAAQAVALLADRPDAAFLGGGTNLVDHLKLGVATPDLLVDVTRLGLDAIEDTDDGGLRIGATVRNSDLAADRRVRERWPALAQALLAGASGQLRNAATTAGNLLQRTRCVYFQDVTTPCNKRAPGAGCSAIGGATKGHAILGASEHCVATHPSDMAVAMAALDAVVHTDRRTMPVAELHRLPGDEPHRDTVLEHGELVTHVTLPPAPPGARQAYRKVRERASYAFALVSVAALVGLDDDGRIADVRIALGGVAHKPWRAAKAEAALCGQPPSAELFDEALDAELVDAHPLADNAFKVPLARATAAAVLADLSGLS